MLYSMVSNAEEMLYKEVRRVSVECHLVNPDWCEFLSEVIQSFIWDRAIRSVSLENE